MQAYEAWIPAGATAAPARATTPARAAAGGKRLRNQNVIDMKKAGLSDANIRMAIDAAESVSFDTSPAGLIALSKAGVSNDVILYMQKKNPR